jgi:hypothetical protein
MTQEGPESRYDMFVITSTCKHDLGIQKDTHTPYSKRHMQLKYTSLDYVSLWLWYPA